MMNGFLFDERGDRSSARLFMGAVLVYVAALIILDATPRFTVSDPAWGIVKIIVIALASWITVGKGTKNVADGFGGGGGP